MAFKYVPVQVLDERGEDLIAEYAKIVDKFEESGGNEHGYTLVCQVFAHKDDACTFFLSGRVLTPEESKAFANILEAGDKVRKEGGVR
jgi:hypothetical protein